MGKSVGNTPTQTERSCIDRQHAVAAPATAFAQEAGSDPTNLDRIEVTGSRLKRAEVEDANPVTVIDRVQLERSGDLSVADFLRNAVYNSYGSTVQESGSSLGSSATINLRGLGSAYTLVLIDGRRVTSSPGLDGAAQNINFIPTAAVERIEVLREGAGAVYGSDAIGGVVNIILRKDYEGGQVSLAYDNPEYGREGRQASGVLGISSDRGNVTVIVDHQERGIMYNREIRDKIPADWWADGASVFTSSANFLSSTGRGVLSYPDAGIVDPNNIEVAPGVYRFDHGVTSASEASLERDSLMANGHYQLTNDIEMFFRATSVETKSFGVYASAPVDTYPTIAADNPYNPFGEDGTLYYRFTPLGTRDTTVTDRLREINFGFRGSNDWLGGADWEVAVGHGRVVSNSIGENYGNGAILQQLIDSGEYNPFDPNDPSVTAAAPLVGHTVLINAEQREVSADGHINFYDVFSLPAGSVQVVTGFEYRDSRLEVNYDAQSVAGNIFGSAGANTGGERAYKAVYFESLLPLLSNLNLTVAGRYDDYNDFGSKFSPHVGLEFRPVDSLLVRGSWGKGFRAPTLTDLYGTTATSNLAISADASLNPAYPGGDEVAAQALAEYQARTGDTSYQPYPVNPTSTSGQYQFLLGSNPNLDAEESKSWGLGVVWNPIDSLSLALDYFDVKLDNVITTLPDGVIIRNYPELVTRGPDIIAPDGTVLPGEIRNIVATTVNADTRRIRGLEFEADYTVDTDYGRFLSQLSWSHRLEDSLVPAGLEELERKGEFGRPEDRGALTVGWGKSDFDISATANYIGSSGDSSDRDNYFPSWTTVDLQLQYKAPWNAKITLGVRNIGNRFPPIVYGVAFPFYDYTLYNSNGRTPYLRYEQNF
ncbi:TonB-dependent receptor [Stenotrophomonas sp. MMGLT7]|uniref:TonB-dependent receptor plug domain-containing protein n=1 Tax=Stenotrophomonas sp. MMGLT7 TaxID=2901227 RepID=UPI001E479B17|nr:TonB-dependent receptor [Stenotrophomonas sp. MMGLT7]MCD7100065.1 TonB-dependent receptor [Stenotrophomonas sp. MMGLT7]